MSEMEELLENVARDIFVASINSIESVQETIPVVLKRRLLPLLEAGQALTNADTQEEFYALAINWDKALEAAKKG